MKASVLAIALMSLMRCSSPTASPARSASPAQPETVAQSPSTSPAVPEVAVLNPLAITLTYKTETVDDFVSKHASDVSSEGIFVASTGDLPASGTYVKLLIRTSAEEPLLSGVCQVAWQSLGEGRVPRGFGLRFVKLDDASSHLVERMLDEQRSRKLASRFDLGGWTGSPRVAVSSEFPNAHSLRLMLELVQDGTVVVKETLVLSSSSKISEFETKAGTVRLAHKFGQPTSSLAIETPSSTTALVIPVHQSADWEHVELPPNGSIRFKVEPIE